MQVGMHINALKAIAEKRRDEFEKRRMTNEVIFQGWIVAGCDQILGRVAPDTLIPQSLWAWVTEKVESLGNTTWKAGRNEVIDEIVFALSAALTTNAQ